MVRFIFPLLILLFTACTPELVKPVKNNGLFLNELQAKGGDWIELYNSTGQAISLEGYEIYDDATAKYTLSGLTIPAKGFLVLTCNGIGTGDQTSFSLSSLGETVYLEKPDGTLIDQVNFPALTKNQSYARFPDGGTDWVITGQPTRGTTNGAGNFASISDVVQVPLVPGLQDNVSVRATVFDAKAIKSVKLFWRLNGAAWQQSAMTLSGAEYTGTIPAAGTTGKIEYYLEAVNSLNLVSLKPSGAPAVPYQYLLNTDPLPQLVINEYLAYNTTCCPDTDSGIAEYDDWLEIFNAGNTAVDVGGLFLSDSIANPFKFQIPKTNPAKTTIQPGKYLVIFADEQGSQGILHASFKVNQFGEEIGLFYIDGRAIDTRIFGLQSLNQSEGRSPDGSATWKKMSPTPGAANK
ncbi:MAG: lamin tail domain-containing protein [Bacteroidota bacterium]